MGKKQKGFTLIEVLISIVIMAIGLLAIAGLATTVIQGNAKSKRMTIAVNLAQAKLEELKNKSYTSSDLNDSNSSNNSSLDSITNYDNQETNIDETGNSGGIYTRTWNIADDVPESNMKTIRVIVSWTDSSSHSVSFYTVISQ